MKPVPIGKPVSGVREVIPSWLAGSEPHLRPAARDPDRENSVGMEGVNAASADIDLEVVRESVRRDRPFGSSGWTHETARALGLEYSLRPRGRPRSVE